MITTFQKEFIGDPNVSTIDYTINTQLAKCIIMNDHHINLTFEQKTLMRSLFDT